MCSYISIEGPYNVQSTYFHTKTMCFLFSTQNHLLLWGSWRTSKKGGNVQKILRVICKDVKQNVTQNALTRLPEGPPTGEDSSWNTRPQSLVIWRSNYPTFIFFPSKCWIHETSCIDLCLRYLYVGLRISSFVAHMILISFVFPPFLRVHPRAHLQFMIRPPLQFTPYHKFHQASGS